VLTFITRRILYSIPVLIVSTFLSFVFVSYAGNPVAILRNNPRIPAQTIHNVEIQNHLNHSIPVRYLYWVQDIFTHKLGNSLVTFQPIWPDIVRTMGHTAQIIVLSEALAMILGILVGIYSAIKQYSIFDYLFTTVSFLGFAMPTFWLALLLQIAFGLSALQAGLMTFASAAAALVMKACAPPILARFGFRTTLQVNAVIVSASFMAYALFKPGTPHWLIYAVLLFGGFFRSLQFTSLNGMAFADIDHAAMSRASTMSTMGQQLAQSMGIGMAAMFLHLSMIHAHASHLTAATIAPAFIAVGAVALISGLFFLPLPADAGSGLHGLQRGRRRR